MTPHRPLHGPSVVRAKSVLFLLLVVATLASAVKVKFTDCLDYSSVDESLYFKPYEVDAVYDDLPDAHNGITNSLRFTVRGVMTGELIDLNTTSNKYSK